jgi:hypothetical protein
MSRSRRDDLGGCIFHQNISKNGTEISERSSFKPPLEYKIKISENQPGDRDILAQPNAGAAA